MFAIANFFISRPKITYFIIFFVTLTGIYSYNKFSKEVFPPINLPTVKVAGGYASASIDNLNKLVVDNLEDGIKNISGIKKMTSFIGKR